MKVLNTRSDYGLVSRVLHWIIVLGILAQWILAEATDLTPHQSLGLILLLVAAVRLAWRLLNEPPAWPADMRPLEVNLARFVHTAFYVLLFALPMSGWALASALAEPLSFFGGFEVPRLVLGGEETLEEVHETLFNVLVGLAALHVLGAIKHWVMSRARAKSGLHAVPGQDPRHLI